MKSEVILLSWVDLRRRTESFMFLSVVDTAFAVHLSIMTHILNSMINNTKLPLGDANSKFVVEVQMSYLTIIPRAYVGYDMVNSQRGA